MNTIYEGYFDYRTDGQPTNIMNMESKGGRPDLRGIQKDPEKTHYNSQIEKLRLHYDFLE